MSMRWARCVLVVAVGWGFMGDGSAFGGAGARSGDVLLTAAGEAHVSGYLVSVAEDWPADDAARVGDCERFVLRLTKERAEAEVAVSHRFYAAKGSFTVSARDLNGDGTPEVLIETLSGRGTGLVDTDLTLLALVGGELIRSLEMQVKGLIWCRDQGWRSPPYVGWEKSVLFRDLNGDGLEDLEVRTELKSRLKGPIVSYEDALRARIEREVLILEPGWSWRLERVELRGQE